MPMTLRRLDDDRTSVPSWRCVMIWSILVVVTIAFLGWTRWLDRQHRGRSDIGDIVRRQDPEGQALRSYIGRDV
ncbi:hypothetical protein ACT8ZV_07430 [Nocardioides sp. MAHUQ-72]|uniref:hypothetical protein n=1 Tax=unclassified Nocardioides TaxID=2615069 RepID=UPI003613FD75